MQEIAPQVFIERAFPGVTLGIINWSTGTILIDAPFRPDDIRTWRLSIQNLGGVTECLLISLDEHYDRTLGARQIECTVVGHEKLTHLLKDRPVNIKPQVVESGAEWELHNAPGNIRWSSPEITFTDHTEIHCENHTLLLESRPGPTPAAIWVTIPTEKIIFLGDAVMPEAVPFIANADLLQWEETLKLLLKPEYRQYQFVSGRAGLVSTNEVKTQIKVLEKINKQVERLSSHPLRNEDVHKAALHILKDCQVPSAHEIHNLQRARFGLTQYLRRTSGALPEQPSVF